MKEEGEVDIELTLSQPNGTPLKSYRGKSQFLKRCNFYEERCWAPYNSSLGKYLDEAFGESMYQIPCIRFGKRLYKIERRLNSFLTSFLFSQDESQEVQHEQGRQHPGLAPQFSKNVLHSASPP